MSQANASGKIILISLAGNLILSFGKLTAFLFSRSPSMLAETIHSFGDSFNQFLLYLGFQRGKIGPCHRYPMGRGRAQYVFNLLAAVGIFLGALYSLEHGIQELLHLGEHHSEVALNFLSIAILTISVLVEGYVFFFALKDINNRRGKTDLMKYLKETDDPSIVAIFLEDGIAISGASFALFGILLSYFLGNPLPDIIASFFISTLLLIMAGYLFMMNYSLIVGRSIARPEQEKIKEFILGQPEVHGIPHMQTEILAPSKIRLSVEVEFQGRALSDPEQVKRTKQKLEKKEASSVIVDTHHRAIRNLGPAIDLLEDKISAEFPSIKIIDIEPY